MLKTTNKPAPSRNDGSWSASSKNIVSKPVSEMNDGKVNKFGGSGVECAKKSRKLKAQKTFKSQKSAKFKKHSKMGIHLILTLQKPARAF